MLQQSDIKKPISAEDIQWLETFNSHNAFLDTGVAITRSDLKKIHRLKREHDLIFVMIHYDFGMTISVYSTPRGCGIPKKLISFSPEQQLPLRDVKNIQKYAERWVKKIFTETKRNLALLKFCGISQLPKYWYWEHAA
jgi:hypothetical protein